MPIPKLGDNAQVEMVEPSTNCKAIPDQSNQSNRPWQALRDPSLRSFRPFIHRFSGAFSMRPRKGRRQKQTRLKWHHSLQSKIKVNLTANGNAAPQLPFLTCQRLNLQLRTAKTVSVGIWSSVFSLFFPASYGHKKKTGGTAAHESAGSLSIKALHIPPTSSRSAPNIY